MEFSFSLQVGLSEKLSRRIDLEIHGRLLHTRGPTEALSTNFPQYRYGQNTPQ